MDSSNMFSSLSSKMNLLLFHSLCFCLEFSASSKIFLGSDIRNCEVKWPRSAFRTLQKLSHRGIARFRLTKEFTEMQSNLAFVMAVK
jgi:hypothetical protein